MPTRQQRRAKARAPAKKKRRGQMAFLAILVAIMLGGGAATALLRFNPKPLTRGAIAGEHWHADYTIELCGRRLAPFPVVEGEIHTHGDGKIHIHPQTAAFTLNNANLGKFMESVESGIGEENGKTFIQLPNGERHQDGDSCTTGGSKQRLVVLVNSEEVTGDPALVVLHDGDDVVIRFGPKATVATANPLATPARPATPAPTAKR